MPRPGCTVDLRRLRSARPSRRLLAECQCRAEIFRTLVPWPALAESWQRDADRMRLQLERATTPHPETGLHATVTEG